MYPVPLFLLQESCSVSAHNIVSEMESVQHSVTPPPSPTSQCVSCSNSEEEEVEAEKAEHGKDPQSDWPKGTVRRATRELEQKIKQEVSMTPPSSPAPACSSRCSPVNTSSGEQTEDTSTQTQLTPDPSTVSNQQYQPQHIVDEMDGDERAEERTGRGGERRLREGEPGHSCSSNSPPSLVLQLDGITEQESYTDSECHSARCPKDMRETWETLKELGAFLWQVSGCSGKGLGQPWSRREQRKGRALTDRTKEVEARIRQAGLTPPSKMKRSASLAKLGLLELSPVDLSELALLTPSTNKSQSDDTSKKKRCTPLPSSSTSPHSSTGSHMLGHADDCETEEAEHCDCDVVPTPLPLSPPSNQCWGRDNAQEAGYAPSAAPAVIPVATRQQYGRTHPLRRLKKRTVNPYHTM